MGILTVAFCRLRRRKGCHRIRTIVPTVSHDDRTKIREWIDIGRSARIYGMLIHSLRFENNVLKFIQSEAVHRHHCLAESGMMRVFRPIDDEGEPQARQGSLSDTNQLKT